jgi:endo-1,4-beta-xylanase
MKWFATEPQQGVFDFSGGDAFIAFSGNRTIRCHNLVWHSQIPTWVSSGNWTRDSLLDVMYNHIEALMVHFGSHCSHWDVVNEALADGPPANGSNPWRNSVFQRVIGPDFVELAFIKAAAVRKAHNINTKLYYNDYSIEWAGAKTNNAAILARNLTSRGVEIDGIGMQSHFTIGGTPSLAGMAASIANYTNKVNTVSGKNLEVALTELDIRANSLPVSYEQQVQQKTDYRNAVGACVTSNGCVGITLWDFDDRYFVHNRLEILDLANSNA